MLRSDTLILPLVRPDDDEVSVAQSRHGGPYQGLDRRRADLDFRTRQRVRVEDPKLQLGGSRCGAAGRLLGPGNGEAGAVLDNRRKLPPRARRRRQVDQEFAAALDSGHAEHLPFDRAATAVLPHDNELSALKATDAGLSLIAGRGRIDQYLVHIPSP